MCLWWKNDVINLKFYLMNILHRFLEEITPDYNINHVNQELKKIDNDFLNMSFFEAIKLCMLNAYSFDESLEMILTVDYDYDYLSMCLDSLQRQAAIKPVNWNEFLSNFPEQKKTKKSKYKSWENPYKYHR